MSTFPYPGLRPFDRSETDIFFGREKHTDQLIDRLGETHFLAVLGPSGCGKSSLVRTGLLAGLETGFLAKAGTHWQVAEFRPGATPFAALAKALLKQTMLGKSYATHFSSYSQAFSILQAGLRQGPYGLDKTLEDMPLPEQTNLIILVDQFEEIFRFHPRKKNDELAAFIALLLQSSRHPKIYTIITMRSDFLGSCTQYYGLPEAISEGLFLTPRLTRNQLRMAIEAPARVFGGQVESDLINSLLNDMGTDPDQLPLLQHALMRMWNLRLAAAGNSELPAQEKPAPEILLSQADLEAVGTFENALSRHADEAYEELTPEQQQIAEILFCSLTERERRAGRRDMRRAAKLEEIAALADRPWQDIAAVVEVFRQERRGFLTPRAGIELTPESMLDISHESLIRQWQRLRDWAQSEADSAELYRRLEDTARRWEKGKAALWQTPELETALAWRKRIDPTASWANRYGEHFKLAMDFLDASKAKHEEALQKIESKRQRELTQANKERIRFRNQSITAIIAFLIVCLLLLWVYQEKNHVIALKDDLQHKNIALGRTYGELERTKNKVAESLFDSQLTYAALLARENDYLTAREILRDTRELDEETKPERQTTRDLLAWHNQVMGGGALQKYERAGAPLFAVAADIENGLLIAAGEKGVLVLFDAKSGRLLKRLTGHEGDVHDVRIHPQGQWAASAGEDGQLMIWSLPAGELARKWEEAAAITALAIRPDGAQVAVATQDGGLSLRQAESGELQQSLKPETVDKPVSVSLAGLTFDASGNLLAAAFRDGTTRIWEAGELRHTFREHTAGATGVAFSPDSTRLATASKDNSVRLWDIASGKLIRVMSGHRDEVYGLGFTSDGRYLVSGSRDRALRVWDVQSGVTLRVLQAQSGGITGLAIPNASKNLLFTADDDGLVRRWDAGLPYRHLDLPGTPAVTALAPDLETIAVGFADGALRLYSLASGTSFMQLQWEQPTAHKNYILRVVFNPAGNLLASAGLDGSVKLWQTVDGTLSEHIVEHKKYVRDVSFSSDGQLLATAGGDGLTGLFSLTTGEKRFFPVDAKAVSAVAFDSNASRLLTTGSYEARLWNITDNPLKLTLEEEYPRAKDELTWSMFVPGSTSKLDEQIISMGRDSIVHFYSAKAKYTNYRLQGHKSTLYRAIFAPGGRQLATVSADATVRFWDLYQEGGELFALPLPIDGYVYDFDFRCTPAGQCKIAVPLSNGKLMLYEPDYLEPPLQTDSGPIEPVNNEEQFIPITSYREWPYSRGIDIFGGFMDYLALINIRDNGINGVRLAWEDCETGYNVERTMACYEQLKHKGPTGAAMFNFLNTAATYEVMPRVANDKIPIVTIGYGRADAVDGRVFPYIFPLLTTYWNQNTAKISFISQHEAEMANIMIANVYHHSGYGKETIKVLEKQAEKYGFTVKHFPVHPPGVEQTDLWNQIQRLNPDWIILRGWGEMTPVALKEAKRIGFPAKRIVGVWWTGSEEDVIPAGDAAIGFTAAAFHPGGDDFDVIRDIRKYVYARHKGHVTEDSIGSIYYNRGVIHGILNTEAIRAAQAKYGHQPLSGEQVRWGLENLNLTDERIKALGAEGFLSPIKTSCSDHEGQGKVRFQQWDGKQWQVISDWITPNYELTRLMVEESATQYAEEHGVIVRDCTKH